MKRILFFILFYLLWFGLLPLGLMLWPAFSYGAGQITETFQSHMSVKHLQIHWVSMANGAVAGSMTPTSTVNGILERITLQPYGGMVPDTGMSLELKDQSGYDIFNGAFTNFLNPTQTTSYVPLVQPVTLTAANITKVGGKVALSDKLDLIVSDAGDSNGGIVHLYYR